MLIKNVAVTLFNVSDFELAQLNKDLELYRVNVVNHDSRPGGKVVHLEILVDEPHPAAPTGVIPHFINVLNDVQAN